MSIVFNAQKAGKQLIWTEVANRKYGGDQESVTG
jgi:hypothetical protein